MKNRAFLILSGLVLCIGVAYGQGLKPPEPGKAVVYFVRVSDYGYGVTFEFFHQDKYIGVIRGQNYMRYECDPGAQLFWASSENKEFLTSELNPDGTYIVVVDVVMGFWKAHVGMSPLDVSNAELFHRAKKLIDSKPPVEISQAQIDKMNKKLADFIPENLNKYETESKYEHNFRHLSADMAIPEDAMK
jgi:hypothetical protein